MADVAAGSSPSPYIWCRGVTQRASEVAVFDLLRAESQRLNVKLRTVARSVLEQAGQSGPPSTEEGG